MVLRWEARVANAPLCLLCLLLRFAVTLSRSTFSDGSCVDHRACEPRYRIDPPDLPWKMVDPHFESGIRFADHRDDQHHRLEKRRCHRSEGYI